MGLGLRLTATAASLLGLVLVSQAGVVPTRTDQIGVDPVTIYPLANIKLHTLAPNPNGPTLTTITTNTFLPGIHNPVPTTIVQENFFSISSNTNGDVAIAVVSPELSKFLKEVFQGAACGAPARKAREVLENRQVTCSLPRPPRPMGIKDFDKIKAWNKKTKMIQNLYEEMLAKAEDSATADLKTHLKQFWEDNPDWTGSELDAVTDSGMDLTVGADEAGLIELETLGGEAGELGALGMSVIGMLYRLYQEEIIQNVVVAEIAVKGATVVSSLIKEIQTYRTTTTTSRTSASSCPTATATTLPGCGAQDCKAKQKEKGLGPGAVCDGGKYDGCDCNPTGEDIIDEKDDKLQRVIDLMYDNMPKEQVNFPNVDGKVECSSKKEGLHAILFRRLASDFCSTLKTWRLDHTVDRSYSADMVAWEGYGGWEFKFKWDNADKQCVNTCEQIFMNEIGDNPNCVPEDQKVSRKGSLKLECGTASFEVIDPNDIAKPQCSDDESKTYKTTVGGPNAAKSTLYGDYCNKLASGEVIATTTLDADNNEQLILSTVLHSGTECTNTCEEAYGIIMDTCGKKGQNADMLSKKGSLDAGCVVYGYELTEKPQPPQPPAAFEPKFDCNGSGNCGGPLLKPKYCDHAVNSLRRDRNNPFWYDTKPDHLNGNCWADIAGDGCGVFLEGDNCSLIGDDLWEIFQQIRDSGCEKCGKKEYSQGCFAKIDYVTGCNNH